MDKFLQNKDSVSVCHKQTCIHAFGKYAKVVAGSLALMFFFIGVAALIENK